MSSREELQRAIEAIEIGMINKQHIGGWDFHLIRHEPLTTALSALRSELDRVDGCEYCLGENPKEIVTLEIDNDDVTAEDITFGFVEPLKNCPYWKGRKCDILEPAQCRSGECGFYPPVEEQRKRKLRANG